MTINHGIPSVLQALPGENYDVYVYLDDGSVRRFNVAHLVRPGTVFEPLRDYDRFRNAITVIGGTVAWDLDGSRDPSTCLDIDPIRISESPRVGDPID